MRHQRNYLFSSQSFSDYSHQALRGVQGLVDQIPKDQFMVSSESELAEYVLSQLTLDPLTLHTEKAVMDQSETRMDVHDWGEVINVPGTQIVIDIPVTGTEMLWRFQPSTFTMNPPVAELSRARGGQQVLQVKIQKRQHSNPEEFQAEYQRTIEQIEQYVGWINNDVAGFNRQLPDYISRAITARRERLEKHEGLSRVLDIPMKARDGTPPVEPIRVTRKIVKPLPVPPASGFQPEPGISDDVYEDILKMVRHEGRSFETTPRTFAKFDEEALRDIVIAHLNGHFEGGATGETFRKSGKTDIRVEDKDRNAFVGECKIWRGAKQIGEALDQLLGYLTWRDCKASLIVFNTQVAGFSALLDKLPDAVSSHPLMIQEYGEQGAGEWRYQFRSHEDEARKVTVHVLIFNLFAN